MKYFHKTMAILFFIAGFLIVLGLKLWIFYSSGCSRLRAPFLALPILVGTVCYYLYPYLAVYIVEYSIIIFVVLKSLVQRVTKPAMPLDNLQNELNKLKQLLDERVITQEEYEHIRKNIIEKTQGR